jgi:hypothetical protein
MIADLWPAVVVHQGEERLALGRHTALGDAAAYFTFLADEFLMKSTVNTK